MMEMIVAILAALVGASLAVQRRFVAVSVEGCSMEPTLRDGDRVLVRRCGLARVRRGQLVVLATAGAELPHPPWRIKRAFALPGDPVPRARVAALRDTTEPEVPSDRLVVLDDNTAMSQTSGQVSYVAADALLGTVVRMIRSRRRPDEPRGGVSRGGNMRRDGGSADGTA